LIGNFRPTDYETGFHMPPSVDGWLQEQHLARFVVEVVGAAGAVGDEPELPRLGVRLLSPDSATENFSVRLHHRGVSFRRCFLNEIERLFVDVLTLAREMGVLKLVHGGP
jgi:hypothetical protein